MAGSLNKVILVGNLGKDPEVRSIPNGAKVANFSIATTERYTDKQGQKVDKTEWHRIVMWRGLAEVAERYLKKGSMICIEGKLTTRSWEDQNGQKRYTTEILADNMQMLGGRNQQSEGGSSMGGYDNNQQPAQSFSPSMQSSSESMPPAPEDDLPF